MSTAGPELPPHLIAKRKRQEEEAQAAESTSPSPNPNSPTISPSNSDSKKRRRTLGPSLPPAPLSELPPSASTKSNNSDPDSSSSDDDFGPSPPTDHLSAAEIHRQQQALDDEAAAAASARKPQREEWMLIPPSADDWTARVDPTKLRNRKFNTGKGSKAPVPTGRGAGGEQHALWTETPEQKRQRLEDEVMGVKKPAQLGGPEKEAAGWREAESRETSRRIQEYNEKNRNTSLYSEHKKSVPKEKEDDPSKRAFDKEKDIGGGIKIGHAQRKELLNRAADFGSRFAGGNYL